MIEMLVLGIFMALFIAGISTLMPKNKYLEMAKNGFFFQIGDQALCTNNAGFAGFLDKGKNYKVIEVIKKYDPKDDQIVVLDNQGVRRVVNATRFIK